MSDILEPHNDSPQPAKDLKWQWQGLNVETSAVESALAKLHTINHPDSHRMRDLPESLRLDRFRGTPSCQSLTCFMWHYNNPPWLATMVPSILRWAKRNAIELKIGKRPPSTNTLKQSIIAQMLRAFLEGTTDWMMYVDADVILHPLAPSVLEEGRKPGLWALHSPNQKQIKKEWAKWVKACFQREVNPSFEHCNDGVWLIDRMSAANFLRHAESYMLPGDFDQHYFNLWLHDTIEEGGTVRRQLPFVLKRLHHLTHGVPNSPGWLYHCAGVDKSKALGDLQLDGFLPHPRPNIEIPAWPEAAVMEKLIALPYHLASDAWQGESLRYALRSLDAHWQHDWPLLVFGSGCPNWLDPSAFVHEPFYAQTLLKACSMAEQVMWMNDDIFFLKNTSVDDLLVPVHHGDMVPQLPRMLRSENRWQRARAHVAGRLYHEIGRDQVWDFSTHTPYLFERKMARKVFDVFGVWHKFPMELAYYGLYGGEGRLIEEKAIMENRDNPTMRWLNIDDSHAGDEALLRWLKERFPRPSRWEKLLG